MEGNIQLSYTQGNYAVNFDGTFSTYSTTSSALLIDIPAPVVNMIMWSSIEACASVICANLPCYAPLLKKAGSISILFTSLRSMFSSRKDLLHSGSSTGSMPKDTSSTEKIIPCPTVIESGTNGGFKRDDRASDMELGHIRRETTMDEEARAGVDKPLPQCPCIARAYSAGNPNYGSAKKLARIL